jgi:hypothetical protein
MSCPMSCGQWSQRLWQHVMVSEQTKSAVSLTGTSTLSNSEGSLAVVAAIACKGVIWSNWEMEKEIHLSSGYDLLPLVPMLFPDIH